MTPGRLTILGGRGALPAEVLHAALDAGWKVRYLSFEDRPEFAETGIDLKKITINKPLDIIFDIRKFRTSHICMAGGIDLSDRNRRGMLGAVRALGGKKKSVPTGDSGLTKFSKALEFAAGAKLLGAHEIAPQLLAEEGHIAGPEADQALIADGKFAIEHALAAGKLDLGQALVCSGQRVVAVEDIGGTDLLLERVGAFVERKLVGDGGHPLILAKAKKPDQPMFADLPAIGPGTISMAEKTGINAIFVEAGKSIIISRAEFTALADEAGIVVYGVRSDGE